METHETNYRRSILLSLSRWLPSRGNVIFTLVIVIAMFWAQSVQALPWSNPSAAANSTNVWPYQGRLNSSAGIPLTAAVPMTFKLYSASSGGTALWQEQWVSVQVTGGLFNVMLGSLTAIPQSIVSGNSNLWLGITVGTDAEMTPRMQLGSVPFAGVVPDNSITTAKIADGAVTTIDLANAAVTRQKLGADVNLVQIQNGYMNVDSVTTPEWTLATSTPGTDVVYIAHVTFSEFFSTAPTILVALNKLDSDASANTRINVYAQNITTTGFDMVFQKWHTTIVYGMAASWIAYGNR